MNVVWCFWLENNIYYVWTCSSSFVKSLGRVIISCTWFTLRVIMHFNQVLDKNIIIFFVLKIQRWSKLQWRTICQFFLMTAFSSLWILINYQTTTFISFSFQLFTLTLNLEYPWVISFWLHIDQVWIQIHIWRWKFLKLKFFLCFLPLII